MRFVPFLIIAIEQIELQFEMVDNVLVGSSRNLEAASTSPALSPNVSAFDFQCRSAIATEGMQ